MAYGRRNQFTIYDKMEQDGYFAKNPANLDSRGPQGEMIYKKIEFPKMVYHPEGEFKITVPAEVVATPLGPKYVGEQRALVSKVVNSPEELAEARSAGWHLTPADSAARAKPVDPDSKKEIIVPASFETLFADMQKQLKLLAEQNTSLQTRLSELES